MSGTLEHHLRVEAVGCRGLKVRRRTHSSDPRVDHQELGLNLGQHLLVATSTSVSVSVVKLSRATFQGAGHFQHIPTTFERRLVVAAYRRVARPYLW